MTTQISTKVQKCKYKIDSHDIEEWKDVAAHHQDPP